MHPPSKRIETVIGCGSSAARNACTINSCAADCGRVHVRVRSSALWPSLLRCEAFALVTSMREHTVDACMSTERIVAGLGKCFGLQVCSLLRLLICELSQRAMGPYSLSISRIPSDGGTSATPQALCRYLERHSSYPRLIIHMSDFDSHLVLDSYPKGIRTLGDRCHATRTSTILNLMVHGISRAFCNYVKAHDLISWAIDFSSPNLTEYFWEFARERGLRCHEISTDPNLNTSDIVQMVSRWGTLQGPSILDVVPAHYCRSHEILQLLVRYLEDKQLSNRLLRRNWLRRRIHEDLKARLPGYRFVSRSLSTFLLSARLCCICFVFPECVMRLTRGGFSTHRETRNPYFPLLVERMASRLRSQCELINRLLEALTSQAFGLKTALSDVTNILDQVMLIHLLRIPTDSLCTLLQAKVGLKLQFGSSPTIVCKEIYPAKYAPWECRHITKVADDCLCMSSGLPYTDFVCNAEFRGQKVRAVLRLHHPNEEFSPVATRMSQDEDYRIRSAASDCHAYERLTFLVHVDPLGTTRLKDPPVSFFDCHGRPVTLITSTLGASSGVMEVLGIPTDFIHNRNTNLGVDMLFKSMKIRLPWWDVSTRRRVYYNHMGRKVGVPFAYAKMLVRKYKATGLSLLECNERVSSMFELPLKLLGKFSNNTERFRVLMNIPPFSTVTNVRLLVRYLLLWGTELMEVLEVKSFLLRRRIYSWTSRKLTEALLKQSRLSLGTQVSVMIVTASMQ